ncbi:MAG TPA: HAMP domain-containing sensor histidine kinase, partial [Chloroflexota bacterium]|nr:HAMP domain-containing sensor histidine kinase [Chloroflexota bacterium]
AHDLRGPITTITGYAQVAARPNATEERRLHAIGVIRNEIRRMEGLVRDLVDAASAGAGQLQVQPRPTDLTALVCGMAETLHTMYPDHVITCATDQHVHGKWDPDRLSQVLNNLIGNAVKYSPTGGEVDIRLWKEDHHAYVQVSDRGRGMRSEDASRLFEPFSRLAAHADLPGTGLGLYIARVLVEAHGGRIWASSPGPDQGATFTFCLPLQ